MSKHWKPGKKTVELGAARPSRIRRDPVPLGKKEAPPPPSPEREKWLGVLGVVLFAAACAVLTVGISEITSHRNTAERAPRAEFGHCYNHSGPNCVLDGDTVYFGGEKLEIAGMDAPEIRAAACPDERSRGIEAAVRLNELLNRGKVTVTGTERGTGGQLLTKLTVDGVDVGATMVSAGVAREYGDGRNSWC